MKKLVLFMAAVMLGLVIAGCGSSQQSSGNKNGTGQSQTDQIQKYQPEPLKRYPDAQSQVKKDHRKVGIIETKYGKIYFELFPDEAPETVANFVYLADSGYYDNLVFHRYEPGFVIQGGDPTGTGGGGPGWTIIDEYNSHKHLKGAVGMATKAPYTNSGGSQFYITLEAQPGLDGNYTVFGQVIKGMDAAEKLRQGDEMLKVTVEDFKSSDEIFKNAGQ